MAESAEPTPGPDPDKSKQEILRVLKEQNHRAYTVGMITEESELKSRKTVNTHVKDLPELYAAVKSEKIGSATAYWWEPVESDGGVSWGQSAVDSLRQNVERAFGRSLFLDAIRVSRQFGYAVIWLGLLVVIADLQGVFEVGPAAYGVLVLLFVFQGLTAVTAWFYKNSFHGPSRRVEN